MSTFGIEEEFFLLERETGLPAVPSGDRLRQLRSPRSSGDVQKEWLACQIEYASPVCQSADEGLEHLRSFRRELAEAAGDNDLIAVGLGAAPAIPVESAMVTDTERYQQIGEHLPGIAAEQYVSGLHIHVSIPDQEAGVVALNAMRPWLPLLVALGANSPYWRAMDTGFASWRTIQYRRWSVQGIPPRFKDALDYRQRLERLMNSDVLLDGGHIGWAARLSANYPTIEARVADSQLRAEDSVLLALVVRALVDTAVENPGMAEDYPPEVLDLAFWQGAKHGMEGDQLDPWTGQPTSIAQQVKKLLQVCEAALHNSGDYEYVEKGLRAMVEQGNGASRQREAFATGSLSSLLDLAERELGA